MLHEQHNFENGPQVWDTDIAIVGMAGRFAGAENIDEYWRNLREGVESVTPFSDDDLLAAGVSPDHLSDPSYVKSGAPLRGMAMFDPALFGLTPREAAIMDPQHRQFLECAWEALENAGHSVERFAGPIGVFGGSGQNAYLARNLLTNPDLVQSVGHFLLRHTGNDKDFLTTRVSYLMDLKGPSMAVQTACSTSLVAIHVAVQSLLSQECDMALAGGVTVELPHNQGYFHEEGGILSPDGHCRPFDKDSQGTIFGSGVGIVVLRRLQDAIESGDHIYAVIKGTAVNNDGSGKVGYLAPSVDGQAHVILEALTIAGVEAETVSYVEAHGTGTPVGDPIEIAALTQAFRRGTDKTNFCAIGSVKGNIGHTDTAAGVASVIKVALAMHNRELPPSINFQSPNDACGFDKSPFYVNHALTPWNPEGGQPRRAGVSSLGVGGTNAHIILEQAPVRAISPTVEGPHLLVLSAASETALDAHCAAVGAHLASNPGASLSDIEYSLQVGRRRLAHRRAVVVNDHADAVAMLSGQVADRMFTHHGGREQRSVAFMFAGGGAQHPNMGLDLYRDKPVFREAVDKCIAILAERCGIEIRSALFPKPGEEEAAARDMERPSIGLPALFIMQYAQAVLWKAKGIQPNGMIGHSMGEYVAAHLAGVFSLADALRLVHLRGRLFETLPAGAMLSVPMSADDIEPLIGAGVSIAATNAPKSTVVSGPCDAIDMLRAQLQEMDIPSSQLRIAVAAHSSMLQPILSDFRYFLDTITFNAPTMPFVSSLSGTWITATEAQDPGYWVRHLREPVRFDLGLSQLLKDQNRDLLEVGPGRVLTALALQHPERQKSQAVLNSSRHPDDAVSDTAHMLGVVGKLWAIGGPVHFGFLQRDGRQRLRVPLPTYPFDHQRYWIDPGVSQSAPESGSGDALTRRSDMAKWFYRPVWARADVAAVAGEEDDDCGAAVLLFADDQGVSDALARVLRGQERDVVMVRPGRRFARKGTDGFTIDPVAPDDYVKLLSTLAAENRLPGRIYHSWSVTGALSGNPIRAADRVQALGFYSLLHLAQAIGIEDVSSPIAMTVVSDGMQRVSGETGRVPAKATLLGPCRVIPRELPNVRVTSVDIVVPTAGSRAERALVDSLIAEPDAGDGAETVALRSGERWVQRFDPASSSSGENLLRDGGTYLLTGGLGEIGLAVALHLAESRAANIVLLARNGLPERSRWLSIITDESADQRTCARIRQVMAIEKTGSQVLVIAADVADQAQVRRAVRQAKARFGKIDGVFHTAGVLDDKVLQMKTASAAGNTLAPKVRGTLALHAALAGERLDFLMLFSSISASIGAAGQVDYAAANAFLDAFAQGHAGDDSNIIAVDWGQWREIGMAAALARAGDPVAQSFVSNPADHPWLDHCLKDQPGERLYVTRFSPSRHWVLDEHRTIGGGALIPGTGFLEIARGALMERPEAGVIEFEQVLFLEPFCVDDGEDRELFTRLKLGEDGAWSFTLSSSSEAGQPDVEPTVHVRGVLRFVGHAEPNRMSIASIRSRCRDNRAIVPAEHMRFGPRWDNVVQIEQGYGETLLTLEMPVSGLEDPAALAIHPALFDMATAGAQTMIPGFDSKVDFLVPVSYDRIRLHRPLTRKLFSHIRLRVDSSDCDVATFDVTIAEEHGLVVAEIREFTMMRLRNQSLLGRTGVAVIATTRITRANDAPGILPVEGMAVIDRILSGAMGPQLVVSPEDFNAVLKVARAPLPCPNAVRPGGQADGEGVGMTATQRMIATLWEELIGVDGIAPSDNFFDLGGHSLLAVQFVNRLRKRTGTTLLATVLLEAPTVAALAALIAPGEQEDADQVAPDALPKQGAGRDAVMISAGANNTPIFLVHDGLGEILLYRTLALKLGGEQPVYGLQPETRSDGNIVHTEITTMAAAHVAKVRRVQPEGPYLLAGLCAGGVIAVEMASQLEQAGETVLYLGIIDAADVAARERPFFTTRARLTRLSRGLSWQAVGPDGVRQLAGKMRGFVQYKQDQRRYDAEMRRAVDELRARGDGEGVSAGPVSAYLDIYKVAHREHRPTGVVKVPHVVLYRATNGTGAADDMPFFEQFSDCALGWGRRVEKGLQIVPVGGGHVSALQEPHVAELARVMRDGIDAALEGAAEQDRVRSSDRSGGQQADAAPVLSELMLP